MFLEESSGGDPQREVPIVSKITNPNADFYKNGKDYWAQLPPTQDAVLGGYSHISTTDIQGSRNFLKQIFNTDKKVVKGRALDCGAGIGRISQCLLATIYNTVDLVEQNPAFLNQAKVILSRQQEHVGEYYPIGLQDFKPEHQYDIVWCQWVLGHLTNDDLVDFFKRCKASLTDKGFLVVKENVASIQNMDLDPVDSSITRSYSLFMELFEKAGLKCFKKQKQMHFPHELYTVYMFALKPVA